MNQTIDDVCVTTQSNSCYHKNAGYARKRHTSPVTILQCHPSQCLLLVLQHRRVTFHGGADNYHAPPATGTSRGIHVVDASRDIKAAAVFTQRDSCIVCQATVIVRVCSNSSLPQVSRAESPHRVRSSSCRFCKTVAFL